MHRDVSSDTREHVVLIAVSTDATERYEIRLQKDRLVARRHFGTCLLTAFATPHGFQPGPWHTVELAWNGPTTRLRIDGKNATPIGPLSGNDLGRQLASVGLGSNDAFDIESFRSTPGSDVVEEAADRAFVAASSCPDLDALFREAPQETWRGVALVHFPSAAHRGPIRGWLDLLPETMVRSIGSVVYVEDARFPKNGSLGEANPGARAIVLKGSSAGDAKVFFHEAAHLHDWALKINLGVPEEKSRWAAISGASCYNKADAPDVFWAEYRKTHVKNGFLGPQGGQCPSEDLAIWVGTVYERYLGKKTMADLLEPSSPSYSEKARPKLDFLLKNGFISGTVFDAMTLRADARAVGARRP